VRVDGVSLDRSGPPEIGFLGRPLVGRVGESFELDDDEVDALRSTLLAGRELTTTLSISLPTPAGAIGEDVPFFRVVLVIQPTLIVDATRGL
jgi:hypothetical protein